MQSLGLENSTPAAETIANNDDLLKQILARLDVESLLRYKRVSKHWLSLISNPKFRDHHTLLHPNPPLSAFLFLSSTHNLTSVSLTGTHSDFNYNPLHFIPKIPSQIKILQSCNGLLLCRFGTRRYSVVNPTTKELSRHLTLPCAAYGLGVALAFDPSIGIIEYNVVAVWSTGPITVGIGAYSSESQRWSSSVECVVHGQSDFDFKHGVYCNGAIHWLSHTDDMFYYRIGFDCDDKQARDGVLASPVGCVDHREYRYFGESSGFLYLIDVFRRCITQFDVWEMKKDYSGWLVKYRVVLDPIIETYRFRISPSDETLMASDRSGWFVNEADVQPTSYSFQEVVGYYMVRYYSFVVLCITGEGKGGDLCLLLYFPSKVISYNLRDRTYKTLCDLALKGSAKTEGFSQVKWLESYLHMESLAHV